MTQDPIKLYLVRYDVRNEGKIITGASLCFADKVGTARERWDAKLRKRYPNNSSVDVRVDAGYTEDEMLRHFVAAEIERNREAKK